MQTECFRFRAFIDFSSDRLDLNQRISYTTEQNWFSSLNMALKESQWWELFVKLKIELSYFLRKKLTTISTLCRLLVKYQLSEIYFVSNNIA